MKKLLFIAFLLICCADAAATIYKCVDENGTVTYTDRGCPQNSSEISIIRGDEQSGSRNIMTHTESWANFRLGMTRSNIYKASAFIYVIMSIICLMLYRSDKKAAIAGQWRKPEATLHFVEFLGGWPGGFIAQRIYRHKTKKVSYQITFWIIVFIHIAVWTDYIFLKSYIYSSVIKFLGTQFSRLT
jgi:uncharacterized membrane protein YsdA (DUF1294 family)